MEKDRILKTVIVNKLEWQAEDDGILRNWQEAMEYALSLGEGWRLPIIEELILLIDFTSYNPACKIDNCRSSSYWSSSPHAYNSSYAWYVHFDNGLYNTSKANHNYVRCVCDIARGTKMKIVCPQCGFSIAVDV